jgi:hypothetical protein
MGPTGETGPAGPAGRDAFEGGAGPIQTIPLTRGSAWRNNRQKVIWVAIYVTLNTDAPSNIAYTASLRTPNDSVFRAVARTVILTNWRAGVVSPIPLAPGAEIVVESGHTGRATIEMQVLNP